MYAVVKTQFGWTVRNETNGQEIEHFARALDAVAYAEEFNALAAEGCTDCGGIHEDGWCAQFERNQRLDRLHDQVCADFERIVAEAPKVGIEATIARALNLSAVSTAIDAQRV